MLVGRTSRWWSVFFSKWTLNVTMPHDSGLIRLILGCLAPNTTIDTAFGSVHVMLANLQGLCRHANRFCGVA